MAPRANTPAVCVTVTIAPSANACRGRPRVPTRYAATIALPCPGDSACTAPQPNAASRRSNKTPSPAAASPKTPVSPSSERCESTAVRLPSGAVRVPAPGRDSRRAARTSDGLSKQVFRIRAQPVGGIARGDVRAHLGAASGSGDDRLPAHPTRERAVAHLDPPRVFDASGQRKLDAGRAQAALSLRVRDRRAAGGAQRDAAAVDRQHEPLVDLGALARQHRRVRHAALLERRDLGLVEDVAHIDPIRGHAHPREVVHGEVAQRMGGRCRRENQREANGPKRGADRCFDIHARHCARRADLDQRRTMKA